MKLPIRLTARRVVALVLVSLVAWWLVHRSLATGTARWDESTAALLGFACALALFESLVRAILFSIGRLRWKPAVFGVARAIIVEGARRRLVPFCFIAASLVIAALAVLIEPSGALVYQVQNFLLYSIVVAITFAVVMTVVLACASVSGDFDEATIHTVLVKPISRHGYLFGKWLGVVLLQGAFLTVAGAQIYLALDVRLASHRGAEELARVRAEVLTARRSYPATPERPIAEYVEQNLARAREASPERWETLGPIGFRRDLEQHYRRLWRRLSRDRSSNFYFADLPTGNRKRELRLRLRPSMVERPNSDSVRLEIQYGSLAPVSVYCELDQYTSQVIPAAAFEDGERLCIRIGNPENDSVFLSGDDGIEVLETVGGYTANLIRCLLLHWIKLSFLAAASVFASAFLSLPVAIVTVAIVALASSASSYLVDVGESGLPYRMLREREWIDRVFDHLEDFGVAVARLFQAYSEIAPTTLLIEGRAIGGDVLLDVGFEIGVLWTGGAALIAVLLFRRREIARVQV